MSSFSECAPEMPEEKWDFCKSAAANCRYETTSVEVKLGGAAATVFEHCFRTFV
jgi:hypothetical protein